MAQLIISQSSLQLLSPFLPIVTEDSDKSGFFNFTSNADTFTSAIDTNFSLNMQAGDDLVNLNGIGNDNIYTGSGRDTVYAGAGSDTVDGGSNTDYLYGEAGYDILHGGGDSDFLYGGTSGDDLYGDAGNDTLYGESGRDFLAGGKGTDRMTGGDDADTFWFDDGDMLFGHGDIINDFSRSEGDKIDLRAIDANTTLTGDQAFTLVDGPSSQVGTMWMSQGSSGQWFVTFNTEPDTDPAFEGEMSLIIYTDYVGGAANMGFEKPIASDFMF